MIEIITQNPKTLISFVIILAGITGIITACELHFGKMIHNARVAERIESGQRIGRRKGDIKEVEMSQFSDEISLGELTESENK